MYCSTPDFSVVHNYLREFPQIHFHWVSDAIQLSHPLSSPSPPALNTSQQQSFPMSQLFASGGQSIGASASASVPSSESSVLIFLYNWLVWSPCSPGNSQESSPAPQIKASLLWHSAFFIVQLLHLYTTTVKTIVLTIWTFVGNVMSLLKNTV